jgi:hypothetical protein
VAGSLRKTGISVIGDLPWGTHFCHFYKTKPDLLNLFVACLKARLKSKGTTIEVLLPLTLRSERANRSLTQ